MSKITHIELEDFMSIEKCSVEFDDTGIINLKGYNDSGKSAVIRAYEVILYNKYPAAHAKFIRDGEGKFSIRLYFDDGVCIVREKFASGQSFYEMTRDGVVLYSSRNGTTYTRIDAVPDIIQQYLGVLSDDEGTTLNSRNCFDPQLLVSTSGGENYRFLNTVLHAEEMTVAANLLSADKSAKQVEVSEHELKMSIFRGEYSRVSRVSDELVDSLEVEEKNFELISRRSAYVDSVRDIHENFLQIVVHPELNQVSGRRVESLSAIKGLTEGLKVPVIPSVVLCGTERLSKIQNVNSISREFEKISVPPDVFSIDSSRLDTLSLIQSASKELDGVNVHPELSDIALSRLNKVCELESFIRELKCINDDIGVINSDLSTLSASIDILSAEIEKTGRKTIKCVSCGNVMVLGDDMTVCCT